jgi:predicted transcriptional regulator
MTRAKYETRLEARELRTQGYSVRDIAKMLNVSTSSASAWVRDIVLTDTQIIQLKKQQLDRIAPARQKGAHTNRTKYKGFREKYQQEGREKAREGDRLHMMGCMLYWAEGAKARNAFVFVNSDERMMQFFTRFLRESLNVPSEDIVFYFHCHTRDEAEIERIRLYWLKTLELPDTSFRKAIFKTGSKIVHNTSLNGICRIQIKNGVRVTQHIYGAVQEYTGLDYPEWLF